MPEAARLSLPMPHPTVVLGCVLLALFSWLYLRTATRGYTFDAVSYALQIRRFEESGEWHWLLHPHHILFNALGWSAHRYLRLFQPGLDPLSALQSLNALLGGLGLALFAAVATRLSGSRAAGALSAAGLGVSYGYWVCGTDGRVNMAGVVALIGASGVLLALLDPRHVAPRGAAARLAVLLGLLHGLAVLLHQSHLLFAPAALAAALLSPGRPRYATPLAYLGTLAAVGLIAYPAASRLATGDASPGGVLAWGLTYAHRGVWWSFDVRRNLGRDVHAFTHAVAAGPALASINEDAPPESGSGAGEASPASPGEADLASATPTARVIWGILLIGVIVAGVRALRPALRLAPSRRLPAPGEAQAPPPGEGEVNGAPLLVFRAAGPLPESSAEERPARIALRSPRVSRAGERVPAGLGSHLPRNRDAGEAPSRSPLTAAEERRLRLAPVLLLWMAAYAAFFTCWNPGYFVFWVPLLVPFWFVLAVGMGFRIRSRGLSALRWAAAVTTVILLARGNCADGIAPLADASRNARLQKALAIRARVIPRDTLVLAGAGDDADAEVYVPYFAGCDVLSLGGLLTHAGRVPEALAALQGEIDRRLASGGRVFVHEELISSDGPYRVLGARSGFARVEMIAFLHRHYRMEPPARWQYPLAAGMAPVGLAPIARSPSP